MFGLILEVCEAIPAEYGHFKNMNQITIVLIHAGPGDLPQHLSESFEIIARIAKSSRIVFLANEANRSSFKKLSENTAFENSTQIEFVSIESFPKSSASKVFEITSTLDKSFREGFWFQASNRFMVLADYLKHTQIQNVIHLENDYVLYFDPSDKFEKFKEFADFAVPVDRVRAIPGIVWIKNPEIVEKLAKFIVNNPTQDDMASVGQFCLLNQDFHAKPLPTLPKEYAIEMGLDPNRYSQGVDLFGGVFDAAAIGQYIGGVHWMNDPADTTFFQNESSDLQLSKFLFAWAVAGGVRYPTIIAKEQRTNVLGLHAHSKNLLGVSPFNHGVSMRASDLVTGERIQQYCDVTMGTLSITQFHGRENIKTAQLVEIAEDQDGNLLPPSVEIISQLVNAKTIFTYTHLLPYFKYFIAPRLNKPFTLVTHNSDHSVNVLDFQLLNHPYLRNWLAQNSEFNHERLIGLPIGLQNKQWGADKLDQLIRAGEAFTKSDLLYVNFSTSTHPSRIEALQVVEDLPGTTIEANVSYATYLASLARHKFCLCPRGNGIDTHRFWEAQYLDSIPVILWRDWTSSYSGMPVLILDHWEELKALDLERIYIVLSTKGYNRSNLDLKKIKQKII